MNFLNRRMFANGGGASTIGDYQIRDKLTGEILIDLSQQPNFINTPGFNPYKILYDDTLEKGPAVLSILQEFKERDAPQIGPFQLGEDIGTNVADLGFGALRVTEPFVRGASRVFGEFTGFQPAKEFGGKQKFSPSIGLGGIDLFKPTYDSYVPTDQDRARAMVGLLKVPEAVSGFSDRVKEQGVFDKEVSPSFDFRDEDIKSKVSQSDYNAYQDEIKPVFDPYNDPITPMLDELSGKSQALKDRFEEDNLQRPIDPGRPPKPLDIADFSNDLIDIKPVDVLKTEIDSKEEMKKKFLPEDIEIELVNVDTDLTPGEAAVINEEGKTPTDKEDTDPITKLAGKPGFFGSDNFLNFIRNVGGELVRTGQFGTGLASGAAKAAEERAARELLADQEERKYQREIELAQAKAAADFKPDIMNVKDIAEYNNKLKKEITDFRGGLAGVGFVDYAIEIIEEAQREGKAVGGFEGLMAKLVDKGFAFAGQGKEFDELSADSKVEALTKVVKQKNLQAILGESGRTISDKDREIIERVFGDLSVFEDPNTTLGLLRESRRGLAAANAERYGNIMSNSELLSRQGFEGSRFYTQLLPSLQSILGIDPFANQSALAKANFAGGTSAPGVTKIGLSG
jgi:hypothetical protein